MEIHETIVNEIWPFVREYYKFPLQLYTETGSSVLLDNQYDLFKFLRSTESMQAYNVQLVEILALCNLMGAKLNVLHFSLFHVFLKRNPAGGGTRIILLLST